MFLAVFQIPAGPAALQDAAAVAGMHVVDVRRRLVGMLPRVLLADVDGERLAGACQALEARGFTAAVVDPASVPGDGQRIVARGLVLPPDAPADRFLVIEGSGSETRHEVPIAAVTLLQRGARAEVETETVQTTERKLAPGRALLTGGLVMRKKVAKTTTQTRESHEPFLLLHRSDGGRDIVLYERKLGYRFLGSEMQPSSRGNFERTIACLRALTGDVPLDARMARSGFVNGLAGSGADPVDLGLHLVRLAHVRGC